MKIDKRLKIMLSGLIMIQSLFLPYSFPKAAAATVFSGNSSGILVANAGQTDVSARIVSEDSEQTDLPQGDETDAKTDGTGEPARVEDGVGTGDDLSAVRLLICVAIILGAAIILFLSVKKLKTSVFI